MTAEVLRPYDPPVSVQKSLRRVSGRAGSTGQPGDTQPVGVLEVNGRYNCADVLVQAPAAWENILVIATVINGGASSVPVDARPVGGMQTRPAGYTPAVFRGILFSIRGRPFSKLAIEVIPAAADLPAATFSAHAWGADNVALQGDRAQRATVDLYARNDQQWHFSGAVAAPATIQGANPSGGRLAITNVSWSQDGLGSVVLASSGGTVLYQARLPAAGAFTPPPFVQPLFLPRGETLDVTAAPAGTVLNAVGFFE